MTDKILQMFFDIDRWTKAIEKGVGKDIRKDQLIRLTDEHTRLEIAGAMLQGRYAISPPHTAQIPKEGGEFRTVYVNEPIDRVILSIANDLLFDLMPEMIHSSCKSYQTGIGCGKVVTEVSHKMVDAEKNGYLGWKSDLSKYFDSVPIRFIDAAFDKVEAKYGHSTLIDVLRKYYHCDLYFDENNTLQSNYQSLKQGCAVASWLADVLLYDLDSELSQMNRKVGGLGYVRTKPDGCIVRGCGRNVKANRSKTAGNISGYLTIGCMRNTLLTSRAVYNTLVASL